MYIHTFMCVRDREYACMCVWVSERERERERERVYVCMYHSNDTLPAEAEGGQVHNPCHRLSAPIYEERAGQPDILVPGSRYSVPGNVCMYGAEGGQVHNPCHRLSAPIYEERAGPQPMPHSVCTYVCSPIYIYSICNFVLVKQVNWVPGDRAESRRGGRRQ
jgi:hypothetical protein